MNTRAGTFVGLVVGLVATGGAITFYWHGQGRPSVKDSDDTYTAEFSEYGPPPVDARNLLTDDRLDDKRHLPFDPALVDRRPFGADDGWLLNASNAVIRLDVPLVKPGQDSALLKLHPSFAAACQAAPGTVLPSVNMVDGKAKQFDDGLYAALDQAYYQGLDHRLRSHVQLIRRLYDRAGPAGSAAAYLAAGLELADVHVPATDQAAKARWLSDFRGNEVASKPIGFYSWNSTLSACFQFLRFFQREFGPDEQLVPQALAKAVARDAGLRTEYRKAVDFYARLTNPNLCLTVADLPTDKPLDSAGLTRLCQSKHVAHAAVALFPASAARETVLFDKLFPLGLPQNANLMQELVRRIRSGAVTLKPGPGSGWYDYQVYALETLLLPERGEERAKLLLSQSYKKRMLEAFEALLTKRRETHSRTVGVATGAKRPPASVSPRLRLEPCPSYYLRTARAYAFLANILEAIVGKSVLEELHGLTEAGPRPRDLYDELQRMRDLFYGLYLVSAEDIGLEPALASAEVAEPERCYALAADWIPTAFKDPDLAVDTRVAVPVMADAPREVTRLWVTVGVRLTRLEASYVRPPSIKPAKGGNWQPVEAHRLGPATYFIAVDEFGEVEVPALTVLTRQELQAVCDHEGTKKAILHALQK